MSRFFSFVKRSTLNLAPFTNVCPVRLLFRGSMAHCLFIWCAKSSLIYDNLSMSFCRARCILNNCVPNNLSATPISLRYITLPNMLTTACGTLPHTQIYGHPSANLHPSHCAICLYRLADCRCDTYGNCVFNPSLLLCERLTSCLSGGTVKYSDQYATFLIPARKIGLPCYLLNNKYVHDKYSMMIN